MRLNPPPNWPDPPEGWVPPPGWQPGPDLPAPPPGWQLWLPDDGPAASPTGSASPWPVSAAPVTAVPTTYQAPGAPGPGTTQPAASLFPAPAGVTAPGGAPGYPGGPTDLPGSSAVHPGGPVAQPDVPAPTTSPASDLRTVTTRFWAGVVVFLIGAGSAYLAAGGRVGVIWTGGMLFGVVLMVRAVIAYLRARRAGVPGYGARGWSGALGGIAVCVVGALAAVSAHASPGSLPGTSATQVGTCWSGTSMLERVGCDDDHDFVGVQVVDSPQDCVADAQDYLDAEGGGYLCLREDS